jgi:hypothetical protein|tara:strand:+ start:324 stop:692 length:369 start_codon:yes stop_codon:yes gene_type:complete
MTENNSYNIDIDTTFKDIDMYIEKTIEQKFNILKDSIKLENKTNNNISELNIFELYQNTIQYMIDIINDISSFLSINHKGYSNQEYRKILFDIFFSNNRILYTGIVFIFISFIIYFIDDISL